MTDLIPISNVQPLNDTWSDYGRPHAWSGYVPVKEDGIPPQWSRVQVFCLNCHQSRLVWHGLSPDRYRWGCPRVPLGYRLRMWWKRQLIPLWSVNSRPPWITPGYTEMRETPRGE